MYDRPFWRERIENTWREVPIAWLCGVRRCGKTTLSRSLGEERLLYVDCDLPTVNEMVRDPQVFYRTLTKPVVVFDEIHQLSDPTRVLKVGADGFPGVKILATGSSTLAASRKFRDTLTGRKRAIHLVPVTWDELPAFGVPVTKRLFFGGLPQALLSEERSAGFYREWLDSFFARDIQRLFGFRDINRFNALFEYVLRQSGGQLEVSRTAAALGITRPTVESHLSALEITNAITRVRPFHGGGQREVVKMPKVYGFDTGFVAYHRGWHTLRPEDLGVLWEHFVLNELYAHRQRRDVRYWRDKQGHEIDFVLPGRGRAVTAIECKWRAAAFEPDNLVIFRRRHPQGPNLVITADTQRSYARRFGEVTVQFAGIESLGALAR